VCGGVGLLQLAAAFQLQLRGARLSIQPQRVLVAGHHDDLVV